MEHLEGRQSVFAALSARQRRMEVILLRHDAHTEPLADLLALAESLGVPVRHVAAAELDLLTHGTTHGGVVAVCSPKPRTTPAQLTALLDGLAEPPLLLLLEGVDDARNLGFTLRSAEAMGVHALLIKKHLWDFDPVEVGRPSSGAYERMPLVQIDDLTLLNDLRKRGLRLFGCLAGVRTTLFEANLTAPTILAIGGEKRGLSGAVRSICDEFLTIPGRPGTASLPLSAAAAVVVAEAMRQRSFPASHPQPNNVGSGSRGSGSG